MNSKKAEVLLKKYWEGDADQTEEMELKKFFSSSAGSSHKDASYFYYLSEKSNKNPLDDQFDEEILGMISKESPSGKIRNINIKYWYVAASLFILLSASIIFKTEIFKTNIPPPVAEQDTFEDPQQAFEETKKALLFLSSRLNQSNEYAAQLSKFEQGQEILKQPVAAGTN